MLQIELSKEAKKALRDIEKHIAQRIAKKISWLAKNSEHINHIHLKGQVDDTPKILFIVMIGHRNEIYMG